MNRRAAAFVLSALVLVVVIAAGVIGWSMADSNTSHKRQPAAQLLTPGVPRIVTVAELGQIAADHPPLYWAGPRPNTQLEATLTTHNGIFVRYLPTGEPVGSRKEFLTIATYSSINGYSALANADSTLADVTKARNGAAIAVFEQKPLSTYFSFPGAQFQVEVFSPTKGESKKLTEDGTITLVNQGS